MEIFRSNSTRELWKDIAFGIAIISIVIGHSFATKTFIAKFVYLYDIPLFFLLAGYFFNFEKYENGFRQLVSSSFQRLIIPAFVACVILYNNFQPDWFVKFLYGSGKSLPQWHIYAIDFSLWFVFCLFVTKILIWTILKIQKKLHFNDFILFIEISVLAYIGKAIGQKIFLPWSFDVAMVALYFTTVGYLFRKYSVLFHPSKRRQLLIGLIAVLWVVLDVFYTNCFNMNERIYGNLLLSLNGAISIGLLICWGAKLIEKVPFLSTLLQYLGINSLVIMIVHGLFYYPPVGIVNTLFRIFCCILVIEICSCVVYLADIFQLKSLHHPLFKGLQTFITTKLSSVGRGD